MRFRSEYFDTKHSEAIVANHYDHAQRFLNEVDAAAVYVCIHFFTEGFEFGYGAEIGISIQKLYVRGSRACLKIHSRHLHAPLCGVFAPHSAGVARYAAIIQRKSTTKI